MAKICILFVLIIPCLCEGNLVWKVAFIVHASFLALVTKITVIGRYLKGVFSLHYYIPENII